MALSHYSAANFSLDLSKFAYCWSSPFGGGIFLFPNHGPQEYRHHYVIKVDKRRRVFLLALSGASIPLLGIDKPLAESLLAFIGAKAFQRYVD
jgi:hypothetical protein